MASELGLLGLLLPICPNTYFCYGAVTHWRISQMCVPGVLEKKKKNGCSETLEIVGNTLLNRYSSVAYAWCKSLYAGVCLGSKRILSMHFFSYVTYECHMRHEGVEYVTNAFSASLSHVVYATCTFRFPKALGRMRHSRVYRMKLTCNLQKYAY